MNTRTTVPLMSGATLRGFGHLRELREDRFELFARVSREARDIARLRVLHVHVTLVNTPELVHEVLVEKAKSFIKSPVVRAVLHPLVGNGLFTSEDPLWRRQRRLMSPLFTASQTDRYAAPMVECITRGVSDMPRDGAMDIAEHMTRITMAVAGRTLFDIDTYGEAHEIGDALTEALAWADETAMSVPLAMQLETRRWLLRAAMRSEETQRPRLAKITQRAADELETPILWPGKRSRALRRAIALLDERVQRMIDERRRDAKHRDDLLSRLIAARDEDGTRMTDRQLRDEILTLFVAGHETTATALAWSFYLLLRNPEVLARVRAEVDALGGAPLDAASVDRLPLATRVFQEAMRLYPPVYFIERMAIEDVVIGGHAIARGALVLTCPYALHRRADVWPDPEKFDPERFAPAAVAARHKTAWVPFSAGPRICIGQRFAMLEGPLVLASVLSKLDLSLASSEAVRPDNYATLRPLGGVHVRARARGADIDGL